MVVVQSTDLQSCPRGWFGQNCQYRCRCKGNNCTANDGSCAGGSKCQAGWFGPACQYEDLAQLDTVIAHGSRQLSIVTDSNDGTCLGESTREISLKWAIPYHITWLRVHVHDSYLRNRFLVKFKTDWNRPVPCTHFRTAKVSDQSVDVHCDLNVTVMQAIVSWDGPANLCSLYVSGGRNVALKQNASQSSTDLRHFRSPTAADAVDGDTSNDYLYGNCPQTKPSDTSPTWTVVFSRNVSVDRFLVYHKIDGHAFLRRSYWFTLQALDAANQAVFTDRGAGSTRQTVYMVTTGADTSPVSQVTIRSAGNRLRFTSAPAVLSLCEVEIYGDTKCDHGRYGRDCEHRCNCADVTEACFVATGGCTSGCDTGFYGEACSLECLPGTFGPNCSWPCSQLCLANSDDVNVCHHVNGTCLLGCQIGFQGPWCNMTCSPGTYGHGCSYECSQLCAPDSDITPACHHLHGVCLNGCQPGYRGTMCTQICPAGQFGQGCSLTCAQSCLSDNRKVPICDHSSGRCLLGCSPGYTSTWCNQTCLPGLYGVLCMYRCPDSCSHDDSGIPTCDHVTGLCVGGCQLGYTGEMCDTLCQPGVYGRDCSSVCSDLCAVSSAGDHSCHHVTGVCLRGCQKGYTGPWCNNTCEKGSHGEQCSLPCPDFCDVTDMSEPVCHHVNGSCRQGCQDGYQGPTCNKTCDSDRFGHGCSFLCPQFCQTSNSSQPVCHHVTGTCLQGCQDGYTGSMCSQICQQGTFGPACSLHCPQFCAGDIPLCDPVNGTCLSECLSGYIGDRCNEKETTGDNVDGTLVVWMIVAVVVVTLVVATSFVCWRKKTLMKSTIANIVFHARVTKSNSTETIINSSISESDDPAGWSCNVGSRVKDTENLRMSGT